MAGVALGVLELTRTCAGPPLEPADLQQAHLLIDHAVSELGQHYERMNLGPDDDPQCLEDLLGGPCARHIAVGTGMAAGLLGRAVSDAYA